MYLIKYVDCKLVKVLKLNVFFQRYDYVLTQLFTDGGQNIMIIA